MGQAVAERTILRPGEDWEQVASRVSFGNISLVSADKRPSDEFKMMNHHMAKATLLMSGRHLQHGDETQPTRNSEVFTNCATSATSFALFLLLLNGSGVGRDYSDSMILTDYDHAPQLRCVLSDDHRDFIWGRHESVRDAKHKYGKGRKVKWHTVDDSREGWAKAMEVYETMTFQKIHSDKTLILDFSNVRPKGAPIGGMQNRPSSGPVPTMDALMNVATLKGLGLDPWMQALYVDHYLAECVLVGGARRAARMSTKSWRDKSVLEFIEAKRPIEYQGLYVEQVAFVRDSKNPTSFLWSSNNSITVDEEFWELLGIPEPGPEGRRQLWKHAQKVFKRLVECSYGDGTGEPGIINADKLNVNLDGWDYEDGSYIGSQKFQVNQDTRLYLSLLASAAKEMKYPMITNPCGEIALTVLGGYCVIADVVPFHADTLDEAEDAFRVATRALMRVNTMDSLYNREVRRTNRIGVGMTGVHEFAWKFFRVGFKDLVNPDFEDYHMGRIRGRQSDDAGTRAADFWMTLARFSRAVKDEAYKYAQVLGVSVPHTDTTIKPAGTTSKLFGLTEGWHLPAFAEYMRWVQFKEDDPLVAQYEALGYPIQRDLKSYRGMVIVGFPTVPTIATLGMGDRLVLAGDATPEDQYRWLLLGEKFYIRGTDKEGNPLPRDSGNQISYTLKMKPEKVGIEAYAETLLQWQSKVKACSVMLQEDGSAYEYLPEEPLTKAKYEEVMRSIMGKADREDVGFEHVDCASGACPVDFSESRVS
jgi:hypothetical protein